MSAYHSSPIKRRRRTKAEIEAIKAAAYEVIEALVRRDWCDGPILLAV